MNLPLTRTVRKFFIITTLFISCYSVDAQEKQEDTYIKTAVTLYNSQQYQLAIDYCGKALALNPLSAYAFNVRGTCNDKLGNRNLAISDFTTAIRLSPKYSNAYYNRANSYYALNNMAQAYADYNMAVTFDPQDKLSLYSKAIIKYNSKEYDEAIKDFTKTIGVDPAYTNAYFYRGTCYYYKTNYSLAIADYNTVLRLDPTYSSAYYNRGLCYSYNGDRKLAINDFTQAIKINSNNASAIEKRGDAYFELKDFDNAISDYTEVLRITPQYANALLSRGSAYFNKKNYKKANEDFDEALKLDPKNVNVTFYKGLMSYDQKDYQPAIDLFSEVIRLDPKNENAYINRGLGYRALEKPELAIADFNYVINNINAKSAYAYVNRGYALVDVGEYEKSIADHTEGLRIDPKFKDAYIGRGVAYFYLGDVSKTIEDETKALELDPNYPNTYTTRAAAYMLQGKYQQAIADYKQAIKVDPTYTNAYLDLFTALVHTSQLDVAADYYKLYQSKNLKPQPSSKSWLFYDHYLSALLNGILEKSYSKALSELNVAEQTYNSDVAGNKKNETKYGLLDILFLKGYVLEKLEQYSEARTAYEQAIAINGNQSDLKDALTRLDKKSAIAVNTDKTAPVIEILSPEATRSIEVVADIANTRIIGKAIDESGIKSVTINAKPVSKLEQDGLFIEQMPLQDGKNVLTVEAIDKNNNKTSQAFTFNIKSYTDNKITNVSNKETIKENPLTYHAVLIAEQEYQDPNLPDLHNPIRDAKDLENILVSKYTFNKDNITILENKSREDIIQSLIQKCNTLSDNDNLLIFYAGHGTAIKNPVDPSDVEGYFVPCSAKYKQEATYISASDIKAALKKSKAKHILLIADACYSGAFTRGLPPDATIDIEKQYKLQSRKVMASGNLEPVPDNSDFLKYLKKRLNDNTDKYMPADVLFNNFRKAVLVNSSTIPLYAPIQNAGDEGGDFIFIKK